MILFALALVTAAKATPTKRAAPVAVVLSAQEELAAIGRLYADAHFEAVVPRARKLLASHGLTGLADLDRTHRVLAFSLFYVDAKADAASELRDLFAINPEAEIVPRDYPPPAVSFFRETKAKWVSDQAPREATAPHGRSWTEFLPIGIGQFVQHDWLYGSLYLGGEVVLVGGNVACLLVRLKLRAADGTYGAKASTAVTLQAVQDVTFVVAIGVAVLSVVDAWQWSPVRMQHKLRLGVVPVAGGAALAGEF